MAFTLAKGITMTVEGDANDYCAKGLSGGKVAAYPSQDVLNTGFILLNKNGTWAVHLLASSKALAIDVQE